MSTGSRSPFSVTSLPIVAVLLVGCFGAAAPDARPSPTALSNPFLAAAPTDAATQVADTSGGCGVGPVFVPEIDGPGHVRLKPGETFTRTWHIRNAGPCAWGAGGKLVFLSGINLSAADAIPIPNTPPGKSVDLSVKMTAPDSPGQYVSTWQIEEAAGGVGPTLSAVVIVVAPTPTPGPVPTEVPVTPTPTIAPTDTPDIPDFDINLDGSQITYDAAETRAIYLSGQQMGNRANVFAKVGDSITASRHFLTPLGGDDYTLGDFDDLEDVITFFKKRGVKNGNSFTISSVTAAGGWTSADPLKQGKVKGQCARKTPLECEYDLIKPSIALIMLGTNDPTSAIKSGAFENNLTRIVQISVQHGVIPVLSTIPRKKSKDVRPFNRVIRQVAAANGAPLMDYWQLTEQLPDSGLSGDGTHPSVSTDIGAGDFSAYGLRYGYNARNLLALQMLDSLRVYVLKK